MNRFPYPTMRECFDLRAYFVVGPDDTKGRPVTDVVAAALRGGATFVQLRAKHADARDLTAMAEAIAAVIAQAGKADTVAFVIDDRADVAWQCRQLGIKIDGVHIGQDDMMPEQARAMLGPDAIIGLSAETLQHIATANALPDGVVDYIGAGPLHYTATKPEAAAVEADGTKHALGIAGAQSLCDASRYPVVVGGGVHTDDIPALARTTAAGWFVVSAIAAADDPESATRQLISAWTAIRGEQRHGYAAAGIAAPTASSSIPFLPHWRTKQPHGLPPVLTVAGSDSSGGAGIQADLKTMMANGVFGMSAITSLTAQNTTGVRAVQNADPAILADQMVATSGAKLIDDDAVAALTTRLFPLATVITPNMPETEALLAQTMQERTSEDDTEFTRLLSEGIRTEADMETAARTLAEHFGCAVLVKGGHGIKDANDVLVEPDGTVTWFTSPRIDNPNTHGTGCTLSSAIASHLALGETLPQAVRSAKDYLTGALAEQLDLGHGSGPMDHAWRWR